MPKLKQCARCGTGIKAWRNLYYCKPCVPHVRKALRKAIGILNYAIATFYWHPAKLFKCVGCGVQATCWDHRDYSKPLLVFPVCNRCNILRGPAEWDQTI